MRCVADNYEYGGEVLLGRRKHEYFLSLYKILH
jgi:hypothetical protein